LSLKSQATATNINRNILSLTKDTVDDSATVRVVTVVTLIYLPASFTTVRAAYPNHDQPAMDEANEFAGSPGDESVRLPIPIKLRFRLPDLSPILDIHLTSPATYFPDRRIMVFYDAKAEEAKGNRASIAGRNR
jgi:hypothetical protein